MANEIPGKPPATTAQCRSFLERIMELDPGDPSAFQDRRLRDHLLTCADCQDLMRTFWSPVPGQLQGGLTNAILERTSGRSCAQVTELLCDLVDGDLEEDQATLVELHLSHCPECARLAEILEAMKRDLPAFAELPPPPGLIDQVLRSLPAFRPQRPGWTGKVQAWFAALPQRPLISIEAAYLGTLLVFLVFGNPFASLPESRRLLAGLAEQSGVVHVVGAGYEGLGQYVDDSFDAVRLATTRLEASGQDLEDLRTELSGKIDTYYGRGQSTFKSVTHFFEQKGSSLKKKLQPEAPER